MAISNSFSKVVLTEGGYKVTFSNGGSKAKPNPTLKKVSNYKAQTSCLEPGCQKRPVNARGFCKDHGRHARDWVAELDATKKPPSHSFYVNLMLEWAGISNGSLSKQSFIYVLGPRGDASRLATLDVFMKDLMEWVVGNVPDATTLQENLMRHRGAGKCGQSIVLPDDLVTLVNLLVDCSFPLKRYGSDKITTKYSGKILKEVPIRVVAALLATAFVCEEANRGDLYHRRRSGGEAEYCGAIMAFSRYVLARRTNIPERIIKMALK